CSAVAIFCSALVGTACTWRGSRTGRASERAGAGRRSRGSAPPSSAGAVASSRSRRRPNSERRRSPPPREAGGVSVPSRTQPSCSARLVHSSHTERRPPPAMYVSARSPRSSVRPHTSQVTASTVVLMSRVAKRPRLPTERLRLYRLRFILRLLDDLLREVRGDLLVALELHRVLALAAGQGPQVGRVGEHLRHRDL